MGLWKSGGGGRKAGWKGRRRRRADFLCRIETGDETGRKNGKEGEGERKKEIRRRFPVAQLDGKVWCPAN